MKNSQRMLIIGSLLVLAVGSALYSLDYRVGDYYTLGDGRLFTASGSPPVPLPAPVPVIMLSEGKLEAVHGASGIFIVEVSGLYSRAGMSFGESAVTGLLLPFVLVVAALYLTLGGSRAAAKRTANVPIAIETLNGDAGRLVTTVQHNMVERGCRLIFIIMALFAPVLIALDITSATLLSQFRLPRWVFLFLIFHALAAGRSVSP